MGFLSPTFSVGVRFQQPVALSGEKTVIQKNWMVGSLVSWHFTFLRNKSMQSTSSKHALQLGAKEVRDVFAIPTISCTQQFARSSVLNPRNLAGIKEQLGRRNKKRAQTVDSICGKYVAPYSAAAKPSILIPTCGKRLKFPDARERK